MMSPFKLLGLLDWKLIYKKLSNLSNIFILIRGGALRLLGQVGLME